LSLSEERRSKTFNEFSVLSGFGIKRKTGGFPVLWKIMKVFIYIIVFLTGLAFVGIQIFMNSGRPEYDGAVTIAGGALGAKATVWRDKYGVAHIEAANEKDAVFALGYVHAQERLFQMELTRRVVKGTLTEIVPDAKTDPGMLGHKSLLEQDKFNRVVGFAMLGEKGVGNLDPESRAILESYSAGINEYVRRAKKLPPEFMLLGLRPAPWTPADSLALGRFVAWGLSANMRHELVRITAIGQLGLERGWEFLPRYPDYGPYIIEPSIKKYDPLGKIIEQYPLPVQPELINGPVAEALLEIDQAVRLDSPAIRGFEEASNNWVVSGARSASGKPLLANDPHLVHLLPSIFFETHIVTGDGLDEIGVTFPGIPMMALGHNRHVAWAATTTRADNQDLFVEKVNPDNPDQYWHVNQWKNFGKRVETFRIKKPGGVKEERLVVRSTVHGVVMNDMLDGIGKGAAPIALAWTGYFPSNEAKAFRELARAKNASEVKQALMGMGNPIQNWLYADDRGDIGFFPSGFYPLRKKGDGTLPVPGWTGEYDWNGYVPFDKLPLLENPSDGVIVTANNAVLPEKDYPFVVSDNYQIYRAMRIRELLKTKEKFTLDDFAKFQMDVYSKQGERLAPVFLAAFEARGDKKDKLAVQAAAALKKWDYQCTPDSIGATIFFHMYKKALELTFADDVSPDLFKEFLELHATDPGMDEKLQTGESSFFDNRNTPRIETRDDIVAAALKETAHFLASHYGDNINKWKWGRTHIVSFAHPFGGVPPLDMLFPVHNIPAYGSRETVFNGYFLLDREVFNVVDGPCFRQVIDMADVPGARMIIDTGQSGHPRSRHIFDQNGLWLRGRLIPMDMDMASVKKKNAGKLVLIPAGK
jgi:penicillin G amidase